MGFLAYIDASVAEHQLYKFAGTTHREGHFPHYKETCIFGISESNLCGSFSLSFQQPYTKRSGRFW